MATTVHPFDARSTPAGGQRARGGWHAAMVAVAVPLLALALTAGCARRNAGNEAPAGGAAPSSTTTPTSTRATPPSTAAAPSATTAAVGTTGDPVDSIDTELDDIDRELRGVDGETKQAGDAISSDEGDPSR